MYAEYKGVELFPNSIIRVREPGKAIEAMDRSRVSPELPGAEPIGDADVEIVLTGRIRGGSAAEVLGHIDTARALIGFEIEHGTLDVNDRVFENVAFAELVIGEAMGRGREASVGFTARFVTYLIKL